MNILGIETSCDETSAAVVRDGREVLSNVVATSLEEHQKFGGIIPEIASRRQLEYINIVTAKAVANAGLSMKDIDAVAVTKTPGLIGSLLVGLTFAGALSYALRKPLVHVNHIHAHIYANYLVERGSLSFDHIYADLPLPAIGLVVSGGHSSLFSIRDFRHFRVIGQTRDDAAGEAYDKVARILALGYPGGPVIDRLARSIKSNDVVFPRAELPGSDDFSFSGVKTAVLYHTRKYAGTDGYSVPKVAAAFQESVISVLAQKSIAACRSRKRFTLLVGGGVAANTSLRERLTDLGAAAGIKVSFPAVSLCMDNAAMVAGLGHLHMLGIDA
ncbi:MAG: tRNA (adenosine(37)-N6)-threonylcarbamoyltransferase complex transferase subunit TsaD [Candidatus Omnitrophota bacterium]